MARQADLPVKFLSRRRLSCRCRVGQERNKNATRIANAIRMARLDTAVLAGTQRGTSGVCRAGNANATNAESGPAPLATTTYCRPLRALYVIGLATIRPAVATRDSSRPLVLSKA